MANTLNTPLTRLRKAAPGSLRQEDVAAAMRKAGLQIVQVTLSDFERGKYQPADERFIALYARITHSSQKAVREAYARTRAEASTRRRPPSRS